MLCAAVLGLLNVQLASKRSIVCMAIIAGVVKFMLRRADRLREVRYAGSHSDTQRSTAASCEDTPARDLVADQILHDQPCETHSQQTTFRHAGFVGRMARRKLGFTRFTNPNDPANVQLATNACWALLRDATVCPNLRLIVADRSLPYAVFACLHPSPHDIAANRLYSSASAVATRDIRKRQVALVPYDGVVGHYLSFLGIGRTIEIVPEVTDRGF
jgi:hypothetical protein